MKLTTTKKWRFTYKSINCEVVFWTNDSMKSEEHRDIYPCKGIWNSYIIINKKSIPRSFKKLIPELKSSKYFKEPYFNYNKLPLEMNGGITFFEAIRNTSGDIIAIKIGNDYNHIWNNPENIGEFSIEKDLRVVVDSVIALFPNFKSWSHVDGKYVKYDELEEYNKKLKQ